MTQILTRREVHDLKILALFTAYYCGKKHADAACFSISGLPDSLKMLEKYSCCESCRQFLEYAIERRIRCPLSVKPACKHCRIHCYRSDYREKVREIMRFSGSGLILRGRLDLLWHFFF